MDPGHRLWYSVLTGDSWSSTGVVPDIWERVSWSVQRRAVGDAVNAFINQRITQIPVAAGAIWWGLLVGRLAVWCLVILGLWRLRQCPWQLTLLSGTLLYILFLPGPIAHDRFYMVAIPLVTAITALGLLKTGK